MAIKKEISSVDKILLHLKSDQRTLKWLSLKTEIPYSTLYSIFKHRIVKLSTDKLDKINKTLGTEFSL